MRIIDKPYIFPSIGHCIYCLERKNLSDEHVIAKLLGGDHIFEKASCPACAKITREFEAHCGIIFGPLRIALNLRFNNPPPDVPVQIEFKDRTENRMVHISQCPTIPVSIPIFPIAGILVGREPSDEIENIQYRMVQVLLPDNEERLKRFKDEGATKISVQGHFGLNPYMRLLAKIAHGFAIAEYGPEAFTPLLPEYILDRYTRLSHVVGCTDIPIAMTNSEIKEGRPRPHTYMVGIQEMRGVHYVAVLIQLFRNLNMPMYEVIAGVAAPGLIKRIVGNPKYPVI